MTVPQRIRRYTPEEYYRLEHAAESKSDYYNGEIFAMAGGTERHSLICTNIGGETRSRLKNSPCRAYESNLRLKVAATGLRCYPDVSVYCQPLAVDLEDPYGQTYTNPTVLFEVLSKSTEAYHRNLKWEHYRRIPSLRAYVMVSQDAPHVEIYERQADGRWAFWEVDGLAAALSIPPLSIELPCSEIYVRVEFPA